MDTSCMSCRSLKALADTLHTYAVEAEAMLDKAVKKANGRGELEDLLTNLLNDIDDVVTHLHDVPPV